MTVFVNKNVVMTTMNKRSLRLIHEEEKTLFIQLEIYKCADMDFPNTNKAVPNRRAQITMTCYVRYTGGDWKES